MKWQMEFYNEKRGMLARYTVDAPSPDGAVLSGRRALVAEHPAARSGRPRLFDQARRVGNQDASGWVLYRIRSAPQD